jgi:hypothetical protein
MSRKFKGQKDQNASLPKIFEILRNLTVIPAKAGIQYFIFIGSGFPSSRE